MTQPHKFLHRLRQQQYQIKQQKLVQEAIEKNLILREMKSELSNKPMQIENQPSQVASPLKVVTPQKQISQVLGNTPDQVD